MPRRGEALAGLAAAELTAGDAWTVVCATLGLLGDGLVCDRPTGLDRGDALPSPLTTRGLPFTAGVAAGSVEMKASW